MCQTQKDYQLIVIVFIVYNSPIILKAKKRGYSKMPNVEEVNNNFENGVGWEKHPEVSEYKTYALHYYRVAADNGHLAAQFKVAQLLFEKNNLREASDYLWKITDIEADDEKEIQDIKQKAKDLRNQIESQFALFFEQAKELENKQDKSTAIELYKKAAQYINSEAQFKVGILLYEEWVKDDSDEEKLDEAVKYLRLAAEQGHLEATWTLIHYVDLTPEEQLKWLCSLNPDEADDQYELATEFEKIGAWSKAHQWFHNAALQDHAEAKEEISKYEREEISKHESLAPKIKPKKRTPFVFNFGDRDIEAAISRDQEKTMPPSPISWKTRQINPCSRLDPKLFNPSKNAVKDLVKNESRIPGSSP